MLDIVYKITVETNIDIIFPQKGHAFSSIRQLVQGNLVGWVVVPKIICPPPNL